MVNDKIVNDVANLQATRLNNVIDPTPQYQDTSFSMNITEEFDPSCLAYLDSDGRLCVDSISVSSELVFDYPFTELVEKGVENINVSFMVEGEGNPVFSAIGFGSPTVKDFQSYEIEVNDTLDVDETITTLSFSKEDIANLMKNELFRLYIVFLQGNDRCNVKLSNIIATFTYVNNIVNEVAVIENRLEALGVDPSREVYSKDEVDGIVEDIVSGDIDLEDYMKWSDYESDLGNQTDTSLFLQALDSTIISITGRGDL